MNKKEYLGDSVYADVNEFGAVVLTTENGYGPSNTVVLETEVFAALVSYIARQTRCEVCGLEKKYHPPINESDSKQRPPIPGK